MSSLRFGTKKIELWVLGDGAIAVDLPLARLSLAAALFESEMRDPHNYTASTASNIPWLRAVTFLTQDLKATCHGCSLLVPVAQRYGDGRRPDRVVALSGDSEQGALCVAF
ncbi:hypothetical protein RRG08_048533 [Elysia crispata]|uniref:Uncharacterized protein n=1 Tax=Elysia crispata TaxID=231223 RepID=A0AAE1B4N8_9GAST|nr:hypothetical protein RRG08_048533 [Elysia crispata]